MSSSTFESPVIDDQLVIDPAASSNAAIPAHRIVKIICRNVIYQCIVAETAPYKKPRSLNWRYQVPGETYNQLSEIVDFQYQQPRAINWRWQPNGKKI